MFKAKIITMYSKVIGNSNKKSRREKHTIVIRFLNYTWIDIISFELDSDE